MTCITGSPCGDPTCYRGGVGDWNYQYKDGPCARADCAWPWQFKNYDGEWVTVPTFDRAFAYASRAASNWRRLPARPHFTDTPATPIVDAGRVAREQRAADVAADVHADQICAAVDRYILSTLWLT